jgi:hypothetical protein
MRFTYDDIALLLDRAVLPDAIAARLRDAPVEVEMSDEHAALINDACMTLLQERGFDQSGALNDFGRHMERIIDTLNED